MWARLYDWFDEPETKKGDNDMLVAAEWYDPDDGLHYVEVYTNPLTSSHKVADQGFDSITCWPIESWGGTIRN